MKAEYMIHQHVEDVLRLLTYENRLVCRVLLHTGIRISDALELKTAQLKPNFWITEKKTGKKKQIGLTAGLLQDILEQAGTVWAFPGDRPGRHRTRQAVWKDIKRAARALRLTENAAPHSLRKVYAVELREKYGFKRAQRALNHASPEVTMIYAMADSLMQQKGRYRAKKRKKS